MCRAWRRPFVVAVAALAIVSFCSTSAFAHSAPTEAKAGGERADQSWRITPSDKPPVQVRRAVHQVKNSASATAAAIADPSADDAEKSEEALEEESDRMASLSEAIDLKRLSRLTGEILTASDASRLVLEPYIDDERWYEAVELLLDDECEEAYALANEVLDEHQDRADKPAIQYTIGRMQLCTDDQRAEGREKLDELADREGPVGEMARRKLGRSSAPHSSSADEALDFRDRIRDAKQRARMGDVDAAIIELDAVHDKLSKGWNRYQVREAQVDILAEAGRVDEAARRMLGIYRTTRDWNIGDSVERKLERLQKRAGVELLTMGERVDRMRELIQRGRYSTARKVSIDNAKIAGVTGDELDGWGYYRRGLQAEKQRNREEADRLFELANQRVDSDVIRPRLYHGWARALRRLDRDEEAIELYERLCDEYPAHNLCDDALFEAGRLSQYLGMHDKARQKFAQVVGLFPDSDKVPESLWRGAFSAYLMGDYMAAVGPLEHLQAHYGGLQDASELTMGLKAQYWKGVAKLKAGQTEAGVEELHKTVSRGPLTWYGRLAAKRLKEAGEEPRANVPKSNLSAEQLKDLSTLRVPHDERLEVAAQYARLGLYSDAIAELREQTSTLSPPERAHQMLAAVYLVDGKPNWAHWIMKSHIDESGPGYHNLRDWGVAFPTDYMKLAHQYGEEYGVSPFLVQAIIRQESGFREKVKSYAGAMGLMQLMPGTARYTQNQFMEDDGRALTRARIVEPETNVRLGTMYIRIHTAYASDQVPLALAGYNAGPAPLESWMERYGDRELDAWVESITYREARGYVRKVYTSYVTYAGLYGDGSLPEVSLELPDNLRDWGEIPEVEQVDEGEPISWLWEHRGE